MAIIQNAGDTTNGTEAGDIIVTNANTTSYGTINAGGGDDFIALEQKPMFVDTANGNNSLATAQSIDFAGNWATTYSALFGDSTIPHTSIIAEAGAAEFNYYVVTLAAGATITLDIDGGSGDGGVGNVDTRVRLYDAVGTQVADGDDSSTTFGGLGSTSGLDSGLTFTSASGGTYYIQVGAFISGSIQPLAIGDNYMLNVSVTGHAATAPATTIWDSTTNAGEGNDQIYGSSEYDTVNGDGGNDVIYTLVGSDTIRGGLGNDQGYAGDGTDLVYEEGGDDVMDGGLGTDTVSYFYASAGVTVNLATTTAQNTVGAGSDTLTGFENLYGSNFDDTLTGDALANVLRGYLGTNTINGAAGNDVIYYTGGSDIVDGGADSDTYDMVNSSVGWTVDLRAGTGNASSGGQTLSITGIETFNGTQYDDIITSRTSVQINAGSGNDYVYAILGTPETIEGGSGIDTIDTSEYNVLNSTYGVNLATGASTDGETYSGFENLVMGDTADTATGSGAANSIWTRGGNDTIDGAAGDDILEGGTGTNSINGGADFDMASYEHATSAVAVSLAAAGAQNTGISTDTLSNIEGLIGSAFNDSLTGNAGDNRFIGGLGNDIMSGGGGTDIVDYRTATAGITASLQVTGPQNTIGAGSDTFVGIESLYGSEFDDVLVGSGDFSAGVVKGFGGNDLIYSALGFDNLDGGDGIDTLNTITFNGDYDVNLATGLTNYGGELMVNFEYLLTGDGNDNLVGTDGYNDITSGAGNDSIDGGLGADTMRGGLDNDTYYVDNADDIVVEANETGYDVINSTVSYTLIGRYAEELVLTGVANINATGNALANTLVGNDGNNLLDGKAGGDNMAGGLGNDVYIVDVVGDVVTEVADAGIDEVRTALLTYTLSADVETLTGLSNAGQTLIGNASVNTIVGGTGVDKLDGGTGADTMNGGRGNDTYTVDNVADVVIETSSTGGTDRVNSSVSYSIAGTYVEKLVLTGPGSNNATGNVFANEVTGNGGANVIDGGGGNDVLRGGGGADTFKFSTAPNAASNFDDIIDFNVAADSIGLASNIFSAGPAGVLAVGRFQTGTVALDAGDRIIYDAATGNIRYDADGNGAGASVLFAHVTPGLALTNADFLIL